jgi:protein O-mannosyl-transferase
LLLAALLLVGVTWSVFAPVRDFDFVNYDDLEFIVNNRHVAGGLTLENVRWAFANPYLGTGGPITWLSHMLDVELFGLDAGRHHVTSVVIHVVNAVLLLWLLWRLTGSVRRSALVAALFALHPLHVESVAWVFQRKDVLSTFFLFLTVAVYARYAERPQARRYLIVMLLFALGLLSKPMLVTLPFILLLLDIWPLGRLPPGPGFGARFPRLAIEKLPLAGLALAAIVATFAAQRQIGAVSPLEHIPLDLRLSNAVVSYVAYLGKTLWPVDLVPYYPYRAAVPLSLAAGSLALLAALTAAAAAAVRRLPAVTVGWFWYLGTLVPVIGIVQVGGHAMADRFTYVPLVGVFIAVAWGAASLRARWCMHPSVPAAIAVAVILGCAAASRAQVMHWRDGVALWEHAVEATPHSSRAHANLGVAYAGEGRTLDAIRHYREAIRLGPPSAHAHNNLALALRDLGRDQEALPHAQEAVRLRPDYANGHGNLAGLLAQSGRFDEAVHHYREAVRLDPTQVLARAGLALSLRETGRLDDAIAQILTALEMAPTEARLHYAAGILLMDASRETEARARFQEALRLQPGYTDAARALQELANRR